MKRYSYKNDGTTNSCYEDQIPTKFTNNIK